MPRTTDCPWAEPEPEALTLSPSPEQWAEARRLLSEAEAVIKDLGACADSDCECGASNLLPAIRAFLSQQVVQAIPKTEE